MADTKTSALTALTTADTAIDIIPIYDASAAELKGITPDDLETSLFSVATPTITLEDAASGGNVSATSATAYEVKVGSYVFVSIGFVNVDTTGLTAGNDVYIKGLTNTAVGASTFNQVGSAGVSNTTATGEIKAIISGATDYLRLSEFNKSAATDFVIVSELSTGVSDIYITMGYFTT